MINTLLYWMWYRVALTYREFFLILAKKHKGSLRRLPDYYPPNSFGYQSAALSDAFGDVMLALSRCFKVEK